MTILKEVYQNTKDVYAKFGKSRVEVMIPVILWGLFVRDGEQELVGLVTGKDYCLIRVDDEYLFNVYGRFMGYDNCEPS